MSSKTRNFSVRTKLHLIEEESGITLVLMAMLSVVLIGMVAVVVDLGKQELALTQLQQAVDAAALSGSRQLNGRPDGWRAAKLAAAMVLKRYPIHGVSPAWQNDLVLNSGDQAFWDSAPDSGYPVPPPSLNVGTAGDSGAFHVTVERGMIWGKESDPNTLEFTSFEANQDGEALSGDTYIFANGIRVTARLDHLQGFFTRIFGSLGFYNLQASAHASMHSSMRRLVAPIAITWDDLMLQTSPQNLARNHLMPFYFPDNQYGREIAVSVMNQNGRSDMLSENPALDADPLGNFAPRDFIDGGVARSDSHIAFPYTTFWSIADRPDLPPDVCFNGSFSGRYPNCKAIKINAYFAMPGVDAVSPDMIVAALEQGGVMGKIGDKVTGLMNLGDFGRDAALSDRIAAVINGGNKSFGEFFFTDGAPNDNYPRARTTRRGVSCPADPGDMLDPLCRPPYDQPPIEVDDGSSPRPNDIVDLNLYFPSEIATAPGEIPQRQRFIMDDKANELPPDPNGNPSGIWHLNWVNPLCHFEQVPLNKLAAPNENRIQEVYAMVIAPRRNTTQNGRPIKYRDFEAMFSGGPQRSIAPVAETLPTLIGFVKIGYFDGNLRALNLRFPLSVARVASPAWGSVAAGNFVEDNNPAYIDLRRNPIGERAETYGGKLQTSYRCYDRTDPADRDRCEQPGPPPEIDSLAMLNECMDIDSIDGTGELQEVLEDLEGWTQVGPCCIASKSECGISDDGRCPGCGDRSGCCVRTCYSNGQGGGSVKMIDKVIALLSTKLKEPVPTRRGRHCLYRLRPDSSDANQLSSYTNLEPNSEGFGCGALRARLAIMNRRPDDFVSLVSGENWSRQTPTLVDVEL